MTESATQRCLKLISAPQGPNRGESLRGGMSHYAIFLWRGRWIYGGVLAPFFAFFRNFFDILTHLKLSCNFLTFFYDFGSIFRGFGKGLGRILGGFFDDFG